MDLFPDFETTIPRTLSELIEAKDKKGIVDLLPTLRSDQFDETVWEAGLSTIGHHHGKPAMIDHVMRQL